MSEASMEMLRNVVIGVVIVIIGILIAGAIYAAWKNVNFFDFFGFKIG